jgi:hypothetical protein
MSTITNKVVMTGVKDVAKMFVPVEEKLATDFINQHTADKTVFTNVDLWNIHRNRKSVARKRSLLSL